MREMVVDDLTESISRDMMETRRIVILGGDVLNPEIATVAKYRERRSFNF